MRDIKLLGQDGDFLMLEDSEGQRYRLLIDDSLRRVSRGESQPKLDDAELSPREIQEEIRVGRSIEEIVRASGASEDYVRKFAQPVLDELNHAVLNALAVRLEIAGDRFNEPQVREFGEIIKSRLAASGAGIESWSAMKAPDHGFFLYCDFELAGEAKRATWSYDPKRLSLAPENELAISLSSQDKLTPAKPRLRPVIEQPAAELADTVDISEYLQETPEQPSYQPPTEQSVADTANLLNTLQQMRAERESGEPAVDTAPSLRVVSDNEEPEPLPSPTDSATKKGRASIPSWDEIVFGTKPEE